MNTAEIKKIWEDVKVELKKVIPAPTFEPWVMPLEPISFEDDQFTLLSGEAFGVEFLKRNHYKNILDAFKIRLGREIIVDIKFDKDLSETIKKQKQKVEKQRQKDIEKEAEHKKAIINQTYVESMNLNLRYKFENFVVDDNNKIAYAASKKVAENPTALYNPLYIFGGSGLGKTHLMQAIGRETMMKDGLKVRCVKTEDFVIDYVSSSGFVPNRSTAVPMNKFRNKYRNVDILLIDDIQFIENKKKCIDELFNTLDTLYNSNKQIVLTSDRLPKDMPEIPKRLRTRFEQGLIVEILPPKFETRVKILENFSKEKGYQNVPYEVFEYIAKYYKDNVRELEGAFTKLSAYSDIQGEPMTLEFAKQVLKCELTSEKPDINTVLKTTAQYYGVSMDDIIGTGRIKTISRARAVVCYIAREKLAMSYENIGKYLNKRHQTVMYSSDNIRNQLNSDKTLFNDVSLILKTLNLI